MKILGYLIILITVFGAGYLGTATDVHWIVPTVVGIGGLFLGGYVASQD